MIRFLKSRFFIFALTALASALSFPYVERKLHPREYLRSYSQEGEDMVLRKLIGKKAKGFFVDIGAYHPIKLSNTYHFYRRGWRGVNIDATPGSMKLFDRFRPEDTNIEVAIGHEEGLIPFYIFKQGALNICDPVLAQERIANEKGVYEVHTIPMLPLNKVLEAVVPSGQHIDFFSIDVEGLDLAVLQTNDWKAFSPDFILVESLQTETIEQALCAPLTQFLKEKGYSLVAKTALTLCFKKDLGEC